MKEDMSEFLKNAYARNKVKELHEAFVEYPPEEEWHHGDIDYVVSEDSTEYGCYQIGDIVFVKDYIYDNNKKGKNHLFVIVDKNNTAVPIENFGMLISSNLNKLRFKTNKLLPKNDCNNLCKDSIVKTDIIYRIFNEQILFKIGTVDHEKIEEYKTSFYSN